MTTETSGVTGGASGGAVRRREGRGPPSRLRSPRAGVVGSRHRPLAQLDEAQELIPAHQPAKHESAVAVTETLPPNVVVEEAEGRPSQRARSHSLEPAFALEGISEKTRGQLPVGAL